MFASAVLCLVVGWLIGVAAGCYGARRMTALLCAVGVIAAGAVSIVGAAILVTGIDVFESRYPIVFLCAAISAVACYVAFELAKSVRR